MKRPTCYPHRVGKLLAICLVILASAASVSAAGSPAQGFGLASRQLPGEKQGDKNDRYNLTTRQLPEDMNDKQNDKEDDNEQDIKTLKPSDSPTPAPTLSSSPTVTPPSAAPSASSTSTPSEEPSPSPSSSPTSSSAPSSAPIPYSRPTRVDIRYVPWIDLPADIVSTATLLDYTEATWNDYGVNQIENLNWDRLSRTQKMYAGILGFERLSWDCWINHYQSLRWLDLDNEGIQSRQWWETLGWDIASWNKYEEPPETNEMYWYYLSEEERFAAAELCYFKRTWDEADVYVDGFPLSKPAYRYTTWSELDEDLRSVATDGLKYDDLLWNVVGLHDVEARDWKQLTLVEQKAAKLLDFSQISWDCWINHFRGYSWEELQFYGLDFFYSTLGWNFLSWVGLEEEPAKKPWEQLNDAERRAAIEVCYSYETWKGYDMTINNGPFPFAKPKRRYVEWVDLPEDIQLLANGTLGYSEENWNNLGSAKIETRGWDELTAEQQTDAIKLGFYKETWDCFHTHYRSYEWGDLGDVRQDVFRLLGWSEARWLSNEIPSTYEKQWNQLSATEQSVANALCFFEHNWDKNNLADENVVVPTNPDPSNPMQDLDASDISDVLNGSKNLANVISTIFTTTFYALATVICVISM